MKKKYWYFTAVVYLKNLSIQKVTVSWCFECGDESTNFPVSIALLKAESEAKKVISEVNDKDPDQFFQGIHVTDHAEIDEDIYESILLTPQISHD